MKNPLRFLASRKFWQRSVFTVACLASITAAFYLIEDYRGEAAWARYRDDAKARGVKLDFQDFIPPPVPDEENFAAIPIFAQLGSRDSAVQKAAVEACKLPSTANAFGNGRDGKPADLAAESALANRLSESWGDGRAGRQMDLAAWQECFALTGMIAARTDDPAADVLRAMERYEPALGQLRTALSRPRSRLKSGWEKGLDADFWHLGGHMQLSKLLGLHQSALLSKESEAEAIADWRIQYRIAGIYKSEPTLLAGMLRAILVNLALDSTWKGLAAERWSDDSLTEMEVQLGDVDLLADFTFAMASERAFFNLVLDQCKISPEGFWTKLFGPGSSKNWPWEKLLPRGWIGQNQRHFNECCDLELAGHEYAPPVASLRKHPRQYHPYWFIADATTFMFGNNREICEQVQSEVDLCRVACALKRFQLANAAYPQTLNELVPGFLSAVPADRFDGRPLHYRRTDDGLVLYSTGKDCRDDGGDEEKDVAWRVSPPRTAEP